MKATRLLLAALALALVSACSSANITGPTPESQANFTEEGRGQFGSGS